MDALHREIRDSKGSSAPILLVVDNDVSTFTVEVQYHDGEKYPALVRVDGVPDYLDEIARPLVAH
jgi:hypothetical protein